MLGDQSGHPAAAMSWISIHQEATGLKNEYTPISMTFWPHDPISMYRHLYVESCKKATGVNITVVSLERRPGDYAEVYSDPSKIQRELNWFAQYTNLTEGLAVAWRWRRTHPVGYPSQ